MDFRDDPSTGSDDALLPGDLSPVNEPGIMIFHSFQGGESYLSQYVGMVISKKPLMAISATPRSTFVSRQRNMTLLPSLATFDIQAASAAIVLVLPCHLLPRRGRMFPRKRRITADFRTPSVVRVHWLRRRQYNGSWAESTCDRPYQQLR